MNCPLCLDATLEVTFHAGIEVDICPRCRGVWLDRGELERIGSERPERDRDRDRDEQRLDPSPGKGNKKTRKKRLAERLGDVFEEIIDL